MTKPKKDGGLGLLLLKDYNFALLSNWWWRYITEDHRLRRRLIHSFHQSSRTWPALPHQKQYPGNWNPIARIENSLGQLGVNLNLLIKGHLGNGKSIRFWPDAWATDKPFKDLFPNLYVTESCKSICVFDCYVL